MKLNEQLIEIVEYGHIESVLTEAAERITQLDSDNAALMKRVAELEEIAAGRAQLIDDQRETIESIQSQLEAKDKRVAELERFAKPGSYWFTRATELESQLAWTPVSAGLPTEPGVYEFHHVSSPHLAPLKLCELRTDGVWEDEDEDSWPSDDFWRYAAMHTHYRRIELPKDGES